MIVSPRPEMKLIILGELDCTIKSKLNGVHKQGLSLLNSETGVSELFCWDFAPSRSKGESACWQHNHDTCCHSFASPNNHCPSYKGCCYRCEQIIWREDEDST